MVSHLDTQLKSHLHQAQNRIKLHQDKHHQDISFEVGDMVELRLKSYQLQSLARQPYKKLSPHFFGPFHILS